MDELGFNFKVEEATIGARKASKAKTDTKGL